MVFLDFTSALYYLDTYGLTDIFLPFILVFTIMFAILQNVQIFTDPKDKSKPNRRVNGIVSLVVALLVVIPHVTGGYPSGYDVVQIINAILPGSMLILIAIVMFLLLVGMIGGASGASAYKSLVAIAAVLGVVYVIMNAVWPNRLPSWLYWISDPGLQSLIVVLLVAGLVIYLIVRDEPKGTWDKSLKSWVFGGNSGGRDKPK